MLKRRMVCEFTPGIVLGDGTLPILLSRMGALTPEGLFCFILTNLRHLSCEADGAKVVKSFGIASMIDDFCKIIRITI